MPRVRVRIVFLICFFWLLLPQPSSAQVSGFKIPGLPGGVTFGPPALPSKAKPQKPVVALGGRTLFQVTGDDAQKAQDRADLVGLRVDAALEKTPPTAASPSVTATPSPNGEIALQLGGHPLVTVSAADAAAKGETVDQLATEWSTTLESRLNQAQRERRPHYLREALIEAAKIIGVAFLINLLIWRLARRFLDRPGWAMQSLVWLIAAFVITDLFPLTRPLHTLLGHGVLRPISILITVSLAASGLSRLLRLFLRHIFPPLPETLSPEERTERTYRRRATLGGVAVVTGVSVIWTIAALVALSWIGVNLTALLTSAGLIGVAIGLATQDTTKDLVAGVNILIDDRFGVGDVVDIKEFSGTVEVLNLRVTQIRDTKGRLITFPNRIIDAVANQTLRWAQADIQINVQHGSDLRLALKTMEDTANALREEWPDRILAAPNMLGVDAINPGDITLRMLVRTLPGDQSPVTREMRLRLMDAFSAQSIAISAPYSKAQVTLVDERISDPLVPSAAN
ncbi:MAG: mechanosensitive ion channel family protein [Capsulimonas sp.]|uniref:mechanosensitive ion channel family protein n=1 Tax=Capsulimonas sp. TaxID=2494211 RepID=UPI003264DFF7